jgi:hypothetical protein
MIKRKLFAFSLAITFFLPLFAGAAEERCFQNSFGQFFRLRGGTLGKKPFVVEFFSANCGFVPGLATSMKDSSGNMMLAIHIADSDACSSVVWYFVGDPILRVASGSFDNLPRNIPPHGADSIANISCNLFPTIGATINAGSINPNAPGSEKN